MGILETIRRNIRRSSRAVSGDKESLTVISSYDDSSFADDHKEGSYLLFSQEPFSPHHGEISTVSFPIANKQRKKRFFEEDSNHLLLDNRDTQQDDYFNFSPSDDEERDDVRLLSRSDADNTRSLAYAFEQYEEEIIFEPSFEVALLAPDKCLTGPVEKKDGVDASPRHFDIDDIFPLPLSNIRSQTRYDMYGRPFVHVFHEGLATLYEESEDLKNNNEARNGNTQDAAKISARWKLALKEMEKEASNNYEWDGILPQRCGNRSAYEI